MTRDSKSADTERRMPKTLAEAHEMLDAFVTDKHKRGIAEITGRGDLGELSPRLFGMHIRNTFGLWGDSPLNRHLKVLGLQHPDDMSEVVIDSYRAYLRGEPFDVREHVARFNTYWKKRKRPKADKGVKRTINFPSKRKGL